MEAHLHDGLSLLLRWAHFITGVAWIGASFYFNWLENHLERQLGNTQQEGKQGHLWAVHGGGFYFLEKYSLPPGKLPQPLHWFKWEAYTTWLTGMALLITVYYWNASIYMLDARVSKLDSASAIALGLGSIVLTWLAYHLLCRLSRDKPLLTTAGCLLGLVLLSWLLSEFLSGRAAYIHVGAAIGTIMVANVFFVIIPAQGDLVAAIADGRQANTDRGREALQRSRHNNYFTLPVLLIMISSHYSATWSHPLNWLVLVSLALTGAGIRHWFNIRHRPESSLLSLYLSIGLLLVTWLAIAPNSPSPASSLSATDEVGEVTPNASPLGGSSDDAAIFALMTTHCTACHASQPAHPGFSSAPLGIELDSEDKMRQQAQRIYQTVVISRMMPLANLSGMTQAERQQIERWFKDITKAHPSHSAQPE